MRIRRPVTPPAPLYDRPRTRPLRLAARVSAPPAVVAPALVTVSTRIAVKLAPWTITPRISASAPRSISRYSATSVADFQGRASDCVRALVAAYDALSCEVALAPAAARRLVHKH